MFFGRASGTWTHGLLHPMQARYQLRHSPMDNNVNQNGLKIKTANKKKTRCKKMSGREEWKTDREKKEHGSSGGATVFVIPQKIKTKAYLPLFGSGNGLGRWFNRFGRDDLRQRVLDSIVGNGFGSGILVAHDITPWRRGFDESRQIGGWLSE